MKNAIFYLIISLTFMSCNSKQDQNVPLFNKISFKLNDGEEVVKIDSYKKKIFKSYFDNDSIQIPLFRCIESDSSLIFISIPFDTSLKKMTDNYLKQTLKQTFFKGDSINYSYKVYNDEKEQITTYTRKFSNNLVYVLTVNHSSELYDSLFNLTELSKRFEH